MRRVGDLVASLTVGEEGPRRPQVARVLTDRELEARTNDDRLERLSRLPPDFLAVVADLQSLLTLSQARALDWAERLQAVGVPDRAAVRELATECARVCVGRPPDLGVMLRAWDERRRQRPTELREIPAECPASAEVAREWIERIRGRLR